MPDPRLNAFLSHATRGLPRPERRLVRAELEGHLHHRVAELRVSGLGEAQALEKALNELGAPALVSRGMRQVYLPRRVWPALAALAMLLSLVALLLPKTPGPLLVEPWDLGQPGLVRPMLIGLDELAESLNRQGVRVEPVAMPSSQAVSLRLPAGELMVRAFWQNDRRYVVLDELVLNALEFGLPVRLSGWERLTLEVGGARVEIGNQGRPANPYSAYANLAREAVLGEAGPLFFRPAGACRHLVRVGGPPGAVYALVTPGAEVSTLETRVADVAPVGPDGVLVLRSDRRDLRLGEGGTALVRLEGGVGQGRSSYTAVQAEVRDLGCR